MSENSGFSWTPEKVDALRAGWRAGKSAERIGAEIGTTKNAVAGKVDRLNLKKRRRTQAEMRAEEARRAEASRAKNLIFDLTAKTCRWPTGHPGDPDFGFCCADAVAGRPYCAAHCKRAYAPRVKDADPAFDSMEPPR
ncbi:MAG: GcrA family cell cycle regulator [Rhodospirillales bacterium]